MFIDRRLIPRILIWAVGEALESCEALIEAANVAKARRYLATGLSAASVDSSRRKFARRTFVFGERYVGDLSFTGEF